MKRYLVESTPSGTQWTECVDGNCVSYADHAAAIAEAQKQREADREIQRAALAEKDRRIAELEKRVCGGCGMCERECETLRGELAGSPKRIIRLENAVRYAALRAELAKSLKREETMREQRELVCKEAQEELDSVLSQHAEIVAGSDITRGLSLGALVDKIREIEP